MVNPVGLVLVLLLLGMLVLGVWSIFRDVGIFLLDKYAFFVATLKPLTSERKTILEKYFFYYNRLDIQDKLKFEGRVNRFLHAKKFVGRGLDVTEEMKVLVSATAVKLTFGLPFLYLSNFNRIAIYPDAYYSIINRKYHYGEVNPMLGLIILSWKNFVSGYIDNQDNRNLGIHELAHAIHFENRIRNDEYDFLDEKLLARWDELARKEIMAIREGANHFFRDYAGTNEHEFFAVSMEYFFESPRAYREALPELYNILSKLLKQNPIELYNL